MPESCVKVCLRVRPENLNEAEGRSVVRFPRPNQVKLHHDRIDKAFTYDYVYDQSSTQVYIYRIIFLRI